MYRKRATSGRESRLCVLRCDSQTYKNPGRQTNGPIAATMLPKISPVACRGHLPMAVAEDTETELLFQLRSVIQ